MTSNSEIRQDEAPPAQTGAQMDRLREQVASLRDERDQTLAYVRRKVDQLLEIMGTVPLRQEELDDKTLLELDPIGIVAEAFAQVLVHLHETNEQLRVTHEELEAVFNTAAVSILVLDPEQRILAYNRTAHELLLDRNENARGAHCFRAVCGRERPLEECSFRRCLEAGGTIRRKDWVRGAHAYDVVATPIRGRHGAVSHVVLVYLDITEVKQTLQALGESEERYRDLFENAHDLIQSLAPDGSFLFVNRAWLETLGYTKKELQGRSIFDVIEPGGVGHCREIFRRVLAGEDVGPIDITFVAKDGRRVEVQGKANCSMLDGKPSATRGIFRDVTEQRRMEEEIARTQKLESLGILAGGIAHDFNNLLSAILSNLTLARLHGSDAPAAGEKLQEAERAVLRARDLTQQLLTFSKGGAPIREEASVRALVRDSAVFALTGSGVGLDLQVPEDLWTAEVDPSQIGQAIHNVVINAVQASPEGGTIQVSCENLELQEELPALPLKPGSHVRISIRDQGAGIPRENLFRIFDPYFTTKEGGTGLGLATAYSVVQRHGGHIDVDSEVGVGSTFQLYLPASRRSTRPPATLEGGDAPVGSGRILLMDDEEMIRDATSDLLELLGYRVETARDGAEAVDLYRNAMAEGEPFQVVLMDLTVPGGMGGREAIQELRKLDPAVKAVVSSGYSNDPVMAEYRRHGFRAVAVKPYRLATLAETLAQVVRDERAALPIQTDGL